MLAFERVLHRRTTGLSQRIEPAAIAAWTDRTTTAEPTTADTEPIVLDLTSEPAGQVWTLRFNGRAGEAAALAELRSGRWPQVRVEDEDGQIRAEGVPGSESPGALVAAFEDLLAGCILLIGKALGDAEGVPAATAGHTVAGAHGAVGTLSSAPVVPAPAPPPLARHILRRTSHAILHRGYRTLYRAPHWRVGWRWADGPGLLDDPDHPPTDWTDLPDDGRHFYADPFPFEHDGRHFLFVEDFEHRIGRGVISMTEFDDDGPIHRPVQVLSHDVHLSYPFVVADQGELWMIPETSGAGTIELYRAQRFPDRWVRERVLMAGLEASDTTVFRHQGRWWMTATVRHGGSFSDALHLWSAEQLAGPWQPHRSNPVLVDISAARPAGRVELRPGAGGDRLLRPVQDGRNGYGAALAIAEITELDDEHFEQQIVARLEPGTWWPGRRIHTLNRAGRLECIDGSAMSPRFRQRPGLPERPVE